MVLEVKAVHRLSCRMLGGDVQCLEVVDLVVIFSEDTPLELVKLLEPDVIVKGGDYTEDTIVGAAEVRSRGGSVVVVPLTPGQSTTAIIRKLGEIK